MGIRHVRTDPRTAVRSPHVPHVLLGCRRFLVVLLQLSEGADMSLSSFSRRCRRLCPGLKLLHTGPHTARPAHTVLQRHTGPNWTPLALSCCLVGHRVQHQTPFRHGASLLCSHRWSCLGQLDMLPEPLRQPSVSVWEKITTVLRNWCWITKLSSCVSKTVCATIS